MIGELFRKYWDLLLVFLLSFIFLLPEIDNICNQVVSMNFDTQNLLVWSYLKDLKTFPIKDTFYPYGLFFYYVSNNQYAFFLYLIAPSFYYTVVYYSLKKLYSKQKYVYIILTAFFFFFTMSLVNIASFVRYGMLPICSLIFSLILLSNIEKKKQYFIVGLVSSLTIFISEGIGVLISLSAVLLLVFDLYIIHSVNKSKFFPRVIKEMRIFIAGFTLGMIPLLIFLVKNQMVGDYLIWIRDIGAMSSYVKTPIALRGRTNMFILIIVFTMLIGILRDTRKTNNLNKKYSYFLIATFLSILVMIPKYVARQSDQILLFYSIFSLVVLPYTLLKVFGAKILKKSLIFIFMMIYIISVNIMLFMPVKLKILKNFKVGASQVLNGGAISNRICDISRFEGRNLNLDESYYKVFDYLSNNHPEEKIFSYPYDPVFYLMLRQSLPPYLNVYEGSPPWAQKSNITYIKANDIKLIIINPTAENVDNVPLEIRAPVLDRYIRDNYKELLEISGFYIFEKQNIR